MSADQQEWTWETVAAYWLGTEPIDKGAMEQVATAHNTALAVGREQSEERHKAVNMLTERCLKAYDDIRQLRETAEKWRKMHLDAVNQVAAERENGAKVYLQLTLLEKKVAAEREKTESAYTAWQAEVTKLRDKLAAEKI